nr:MAG TPA: hypothetical protein [Caudoviricetes sp.]
MTDILSDLSNLTTINYKTLIRTSNIIIGCICEAIRESEVNNKDITEVNIGIGTLIIKKEDKEFKFKFVPSDLFKKLLVSTLKNKTMPLDIILEDSLISKLTNTYKTLL